MTLLCVAAIADWGYDDIHLFLPAKNLWLHDRMRYEAGHLRCLTLALAVSFACPDGLPLGPSDDAPIPAATWFKTEPGSHPVGIRRRDAHSSPHAPRVLRGDDPTDDSDEGDDACPLSPVPITSAPRDLPLLIPAHLGTPGPITGPTPATLGVSCRLRC